MDDTPFDTHAFDLDDELDVDEEDNTATDASTDDEWRTDFTADSGRRTRHDGWTPDRQYRFLTALAESGCVAEACRAVGMSHTAAYRLRRQDDAESFRRAWDMALDHAVTRLTDAAFGRALHGTVRPVFFQGEQVGERRYFDERLTMFILRYRDPARYGKWLDKMEVRQAFDGPTALAEAYARDAHEDALAGELGLPRRRRRPLPMWRDGDDPDANFQAEPPFTPPDDPWPPYDPDQDH